MRRARIAVAYHLPLRRVAGPASGSRRQDAPFVEGQLLGLVDVNEIAFRRQRLARVVHAGQPETGTIRVVVPLRSLTAVGVGRVAVVENLSLVGLQDRREDR